MNKKFLQTLITIIFLMTGCSPSGRATPIIATQDGTATSSSIPTNTITTTPTETPTASITPLPTIPTFTPIFDTRTILTVTPAPQAECPKEDQSFVPDFTVPDLAKCNATGNTDYCYPNDTPQSILSFLNQGGSVQSVITRLRQVGAEYAYQDITGDSISDLMFVDFRSFRGFNIFTCKMGQFELFQPLIDPPANFNSINDANSNGIPEVVLEGGYCSGSGCFDVYVYEWDGNMFINLSPEASVYGLKKLEIKDVDKNGTNEIILTGNLISSFFLEYYQGAPWREEIHTYIWNGKTFTSSHIEYLPPEYRFQAIQDGDNQILNGNYDKALRSYQDAIFSATLEWFSSERKKYIETLGGVYGQSKTPQPLIPDTTEYPPLAAYAYYRILLLHILQGHEPDAGTVYKTLQQKFGSDQYGSSYAEMATAFWNSYQSTHKMYNGCAAAIQYAAEHPEILVPLGSDYHGSQSHTYMPADVCPFR